MIHLNALLFIISPTVLVWRTPLYDNHGGLQQQQKQQLGEFESLQISATADVWTSKRNVRLLNVMENDSDPTSSYELIWSMQRELVQDHLDRLSIVSSITDADATLSTSQFISDDTTTSGDTSSRKGLDSVLMVQHEPVYTLGTGSDTQFIKSTDVKVVRIERGGEVTYHGPGQLVIYPILDLRGYKQDVHWYLRALEESILLALKKCGIPHAQREMDLTGIWVQGRKIAAVGIKIKRWITMHGLSINVEKTSLDPFQGIVPCGLVGREVCCINDFVDKPLTVAEFSVYMRQAMEEIFCIQLQDAPTKHF